MSSVLASNLSWRESTGKQTSLDVKFCGLNIYLICTNVHDFARN